MSFLKRMYKKGEETVNEFKIKYSDPVKEFENELKNLKTEHQNIKKFIAQIKALRIKAEKDIEMHMQKIEQYKINASEFLSKAKSGEIKPEIADKLALNALNIKNAYAERVEQLKSKIPQYDEKIQTLTEKEENYAQKIEHYSAEYEYLKTQNNLRINRTDIDKNLFFDDSEIILKLENLKKKIEDREYRNDYYSKYSEKYSDETIYSAKLNDELQKLKNSKK